MHTALAAVCLVSPCLAQDSITVIDRGTPPARIWTIVELPFKLLEAPLRLVGGVAGWVANRAESGRWVPAVRRVHSGLEARGIRPAVSGQGPNSGFGPSLRLGSGPRDDRGPWGFVQGGLTLREYWHTEVRAGIRWTEAYVRVEDRPRDLFFGIGNGAREADWSDYQLRRAVWGSRTRVDASPHLAFSADLEWAEVTTSSGSADDIPDIDSAFTPAERPGFGATHRFVSVSAGAEWASGERHAGARRGSWIAGSYRWIDSRSSGVPDFGVLSANGGVEVPLDHHRRSLAFAIYLESLRTASPDQVPFYALPTLGGAHSLPSFRSARFRDREVLVAKIEYRYRVWSDPADAIAADAVLFTHGGMVSRRLRNEFAAARLHRSTGFAVVLMTRAATLARVAVSSGADGVGLTIAAGTGF